MALIVGGPPCQGYSGIGHRRSYDVNKKELPSNFSIKDKELDISELELLAAKRPTKKLIDLKSLLDVL